MVTNSSCSTVDFTTVDFTVTLPSPGFSQLLDDPVLRTFVANTSVICKNRPLLLKLLVYLPFGTYLDERMYLRSKVDTVLRCAQTIIKTEASRLWRSEQMGRLGRKKGRKKGKKTVWVKLGDMRGFEPSLNDMLHGQVPLLNVGSCPVESRKFVELLHRRILCRTSDGEWTCGTMRLKVKKLEILASMGPAQNADPCEYTHQLLFRSPYREFVGPAGDCTSTWCL